MDISQWSGNGYLPMDPSPSLRSDGADLLSRLHWWSPVGVECRAKSTREPPVPWRAAELRKNFRSGGLDPGRMGTSESQSQVIPNGANNSLAHKRTG